MANERWLTLALIVGLIFLGSGIVADENITTEPGEMPVSSTERTQVENPVETPMLVDIARVLEKTQRGWQESCTPGAECNHIIDPACGTQGCRRRDADEPLEGAVEGGQALVADLGDDGTADALVRQTSKQTHFGLARRLQKDSGTEIYLHPADAKRASRGGVQIPPTGLLANAWRRTPFRILTTAARKGVFFSPPIRPFVPLSSKGPLDVPGKPEVPFVPGHTRGSVAFWLPDRRALGRRHETSRPAGAVRLFPRAAGAP